MNKLLLLVASGFLMLALIANLQNTSKSSNDTPKKIALVIGNGN